MIRKIPYSEIDFEKYECCIETAFQKNFYAKKEILDFLCENWELLIYGDYDFVMPIPITRKFSFNVVIQPLFCQQLGVFSSKINPQIEHKFLVYFKKKYAIYQYAFNSENDLSPSKGTFRTLWLNHYNYVKENMEEYNFLENFSNCPLIESIESEHKLDYCPTFESLFDKSKSNGLVLNLNNDLIFSQLFSPINYLVKKKTSAGISLSTAELIEIFEASWRGISKQ